MSSTSLVDIKDPNISLAEKLRRHAAHKRKTGVYVKAKDANRLGIILYYFTILGGVVWHETIVLPTLYAGEWEGWALFVQLLLAFLAAEVALNCYLIRRVRSEYQPAIHGTKPPDFPVYNTSVIDTSSELSVASGMESLEINMPRPESQDNGRERRPNTTGDGSNIAVNGKAASSDTNAVDLNDAPPDPSTKRSYDGHSFKMMVATSLPTADGQIERKPFPYWSWVPCLMCQRLRPPRCHHCVLCKHCVLKRDHHCYFSGACIGVNNYRFFIVFLFWSFILTSFGTYHTVPYLFQHLVPDYNLSYYDLIFPVHIVRGVFGYISLMVTPLIMVAWCIFACNVFSLTMTVGAMHLLVKGKTTFERENGIKVTDCRSLHGKLLSVFGEYWWVNFLVPLYPWIKPREDPVLWPHIKPY